MKKILYSVFALAIAAFTFTSCEDVPAPYDDPNGTIDMPIVIEPSGDGTAASPYNVARILELAGALESGENLPEKVYITGVVVDITENYNGGHGNAQFKIADYEDSNKTFEIYRAKYLNNQSWQEGQDILEFGDSVVVYGTVTNYNGTLETAQNDAYLVYLNGQTGDGGGNEPTPGVEPEGDGSLENPYNVAGIIAYVSTFEANEQSPNDVYIKGKVASIKENYDEADPQYGNATYYISDDGNNDNTFYIYHSYYLGNTKYTSGDVLKVGDEVIVCGKVTNYVGDKGYSTLETVGGQSYLYSLNSVGGGDEPGTGDDEPITGGEVVGNSVVVKANGFGLADKTGLSVLTLVDGTTLTFDKNGGYTAPAFYTLGDGSFRMYPSNTLTISSAKTIESVDIKCDEYQGTIYNASGDISTSAGTINVDGAAVTVTGASTNSLVLTNTSTTTGAPSQIRIVELTIHYAE
jgi:hypothetical protein